MNYITALPDFIAMQRISFCWFITQGLTEELSLFSRIHDFSQNTEYVLFGEEYSLIKPPCSLAIARKYNGNYRAQLVIPIEVRNTKINNIRYHNQFPIITLPLMTTAATFIINGCERVIVSQIIRSPGVYFERNRNQKKRNQFKRKLSTDMSKLRSFLPSGEAFLSEFDLFTPVQEAIPHWKKTSIFSYSIALLRDSQKNSTFYFLQCFKLYRIITTSSKQKQKKELIQLFLKWLKVKQNISSFNSDFKEEKTVYVVHYFNLLIRLLIKYEIFQKSWISSKTKSVVTSEKKWLDTLLQKTPSPFLPNPNKFSKSQILQLLDTYDEHILNSQKYTQIQLNRKLILITKDSKDWLSEMRNFYFLKRTVQQLTQKIQETNHIIEFKELRPTIYFSTSLKDQLKYIFGKNKLLYDPKRHKYIKTKAHLLLYN